MSSVCVRSTYMYIFLGNYHLLRVPIQVLGVLQSDHLKLPIDKPTTWKQVERTLVVHTRDYRCRRHRATWYKGPTWTHGGDGKTNPRRAHAQPPPSYVLEW
jgi:hypothetical protein